MRTIALPVNLLSEGSRQKISDFEPWLLRSGKAYQTIRSYLYAARQFLSLYPDVTHDNLLLYKCYLIERYKPRTVNLRIRAINCFMEFLGIPASKLLMVRLQQRPFLENVISQADYEYLKKCLIRDGKTNYYLAVRIMAATGVRISGTCSDPDRGYPAWSARPLFKRQQDPTYLFPPQCTGDLSDVAAKRKQVQRQSVPEPLWPSYQY